MSRRSDEYQAGVPQKSYDLLFEGVIVFVAVLVVVVVFAATVGSPDYPTVRGEDVANLQPIAFSKTATTILAGKSSLQTYGPPYTNDTQNAQEILGISPATWAGVRIPIDASKAFVIRPLTRLAIIVPDIAAALEAYQSASNEQRAAWNQAYLDALDHAGLANGQVTVAAGEYGPVPVMIQGLRRLAEAGLLEGALQADSRLPYALDNTKPLLFFQDDVDESVAERLDLLGNQWGLVHETGFYPGAWWIAPYSFFYQIPPMSSSANADLEVGLIMVALFLLLIFLPVIPGLNRIPRALRLYRLIWRDWYRRQESDEAARGRSEERRP